MKLINCKAYAIQAPASHNGHGGEIFTFLKLETDTGIVGWGECAAQDAFQANWKPYISLVEGLFEKFVKGEDALAREKIMKKMYARFAAFHSDFIAACVFSAFDLALWDIAGKVCGQPVYQLLGGKYRERIRSYTYIYTQPDLPNPAGWKNKEVLVRHAKRFVDMGYDAVKFDPIAPVDRLGYPAAPWELSLSELEYAEEAVGALRDAVGRRVDILIGTHGQLTTASAIRLGKMLEKYQILWFEEPVNPENAKEMGRVAKAVNVPVATGERLAFTYDFQRLFEEDGCAIAQPDLGSAGGITESKKIASMAEPKYIQMAPHCWGGPLILAAAIQLDTCISNFLIQECIDEGSKGFFGEILDEPFEWQDGYFKTLERPGLGVNLVEEAIEKYAL